MTVIPTLSYTQIVHALERAGFVSAGQSGINIRMLKWASDGRRIRVFVPALKPVPPQILSKIIKAAELTREQFESYR